jgi:hypothetical protein
MEKCKQVIITMERVEGPFRCGIPSHCGTMAGIVLRWRQNESHQ